MGRAVMPDHTTSKGLDRKPADAGSRPVAVFAMDPDKTRYVFTAEHMRRLSDLCQLPASRPLQGFDPNKFSDCPPCTTSLNAMQ